MAIRHKLAVFMISTLMFGAVSVNAEENGAIYGSNGQISFTGEYKEEIGPVPTPQEPSVKPPGGNTMLPQTGESLNQWLSVVGITISIVASSALFLKNHKAGRRKLL